MANEQNGAERAFEELRAELTVMRRTVEQLADAVGEVPRVDYSVTLATVLKGHTVIARHIQHIAQVSGAYVPADQLEAEMARAREAAMRPLRADVQLAKDALRLAAQRFEVAAGTVRTRQDQWRKISWAAAIGIVVGLVAYPAVVRPVLGAVQGYWKAAK